MLHLRAWYAQAHPAEDFAETFAVWLTPGSRWRQRYKGWTALHKLDYIEELMEELAGTRPVNRTRTKVEPLSALKIFAAFFPTIQNTRVDPAQPVLSAACDGRCGRL